MKDESEWVKIPGHHPAIVSKELYEHARKTIRRPKSVKKNIHLYPLRGKVYCGCCLHAMARYGQKNPRFVCTHSQANENAACHGLSIAETELEKLLYTIAEKQENVVLAAANLEDRTAFDIHVNRKAECDKQIYEVQNRKRALFEQLILQELSEQEFKAQKAACDAELHRLQEMQTNLAAQLSRQQVDEQTKSTNRELAQKVTDTGQLSSELMDALIERVYIYPGQEIEIIWKVRGFGSSGKELQKIF